MKAIFTSLCLGLVCFASAQNTFKARVFSAGGGILRKSVELSDGSIVSVGNLFADDAMWLVKTGPTGAVLASQQINTPGHDEGYDIVTTSDGGFAVTGALDNQTGLLKFGANMSLQWKKEYTTFYGSLGLTLVQTADGGYLVGGQTADENNRYPAGNLIKTDSLGTIQFQKRYFDFGDSYFLALSPTTDGSYAFLAGNDSGGGKFIGKIRPDGTFAWVEEYSDVDFRTKGLNDIIGTSDGGMVATGYAEVNATQYHLDIAMIKLGAGGGVEWSKLLRNTRNCIASAVAEDKDGGYLFAGHSGLYDFDAYVVKTTAGGTLVWQKTFDVNSGSSQHSNFHGLMATSDGGFVTTGDGTFIDPLSVSGTVYKFTGSFDACDSAAGTDDGYLLNAGTTEPASLAAVNTTLSDDVADFTITDVDNLINYVCSITLPVRFTSFTAALQGKSVSVNWTTANEVNTDHFVVERSADKVAFTALQKVAAKGNNSITQLYSINDLQPLPGTSYYRLKEVDKDGKMMYSSVVPVTVMSNGTIVISPNPVRDNIRVIVQSSVSNNLTLQVVDMRGSMLAAQTKAVGAGRNEVNIPASSLAKGIYILKVMDKASVQTIRFVKE